MSSISLCLFLHASPSTKSTRLSHTRLCPSLYHFGINFHHTCLRSFPCLPALISLVFPLLPPCLLHFPLLVPSPTSISSPILLFSHAATFHHHQRLLHDTILAHSTFTSNLDSVYTTPPCSLLLAPTRFLRAATFCLYFPLPLSTIQSWTGSTY
ncbi:hypothetical protein F5Y15DRAFT_404736 [Xylariaceae sp. FL0016]|nr:hypothetical protein F5Y15DRAFT_404736 [Xylariaceae sp. FL0016]